MPSSREEAAINEKLELLALLEKEERAFATEDFLSFVHATHPDYIESWHHKLIADRLSRLAHEKRQRVMIFVPPQYGKSELVSRSYPAWLLGLDPSKKVVVSSYSGDLAHTFNRAAQDIMTMEAYRDIFPNTKIAPEVKERRRENEAVTSAKGYLYSVGRGGSLTGRSCTDLIIDDPLKDLKEALSDTTTSDLISWFMAVASTRMTLDGNIVLMFTRWSSKDLGSFLLDRMKQSDKFEQWEVISLPALAEGDLHPEDPRAEGEALWPDVKGDEEHLRALRLELGSKIFSALYQQDPVGEGGNVVKDSWFKVYEDRKHEDWFDELVMSVDCGFKDADDSDYVVIQVWGRKGEDKYLLDQTRERMNVKKTCEEITKLSRRWSRCYKKLVEDKANGPAVIQLLESEVVGISAQQPIGSKESRFNAVAPMFESGNIYIPAPNIATFGTHDYIRELCEFPGSMYDDQVDATAYALLWLGRGERHFLRRLLGV